jgi:hypothetical protein
MNVEQVITGTEPRPSLEWFYDEDENWRHKDSDYFKRLAAKHAVEAAQRERRDARTAKWSGVGTALGYIFVFVVPFVVTVLFLLGKVPYWLYGWLGI